MLVSLLQFILALEAPPSVLLDVHKATAACHRALASRALEEFSANALKVTLFETGFEGSDADSLRRVSSWVWHMS